MAWMKKEYYQAMENYFVKVCENADVLTVAEVLAMATHSEFGGAYMCNLLSDLVERGISLPAIREFESFSENWGKAVNSHFKYISQSIIFQDFLDEIHINY